MSALTKIFVVANLILAVALAFSELTYFSHAHNYRALYQDAQKEIALLKEKLSEEKSSFEASRMILSARNDFLNRTLDHDRAMLAQFEKAQHEQFRQVREMEESLKAALTNMTLVHQEIQNAHAELKVAQSVRDEARAQSESAHKIKEDAVKRLADLEAQMEGLQRDAVDLERKYQQASTDLRQREQMLARLKQQGYDIEGGALPRITGTVMAVDEASGVVVLNVGSNNQVKVGHQFSVIRDDKFMGKIQVTDVNPAWAGAVLVRGMQKGTIKIGDQVATVIE